MKKEIIPTSIDYAILGLIKNEAQSGYGIRKIFETTAMGIFSNSPGTIYPALKRLQKFELVENRKNESDGKNKFHITTSGLQILKKWVTQPLEKNDVEKKLDEVFLRFAFMDDLSSLEEKITFLKSLQNLITIFLQGLQAYHKNEAHNIPVTGRLSFEHGIESYKTTLKWCKKSIQFLTSKNNIK